MQIKMNLLCNFKLIDENLDKIMFDWQLNVERANTENIFENLKKIGFCIASMHVLIIFFEIMVVCYVLHNHYQLMGVSLPLIKGL